MYKTYMKSSRQKARHSKLSVNGLIGDFLGVVRIQRTEMRQVETRQVGMYVYPSSTVKSVLMQLILG